MPHYIKLLLIISLGLTNLSLAQALEYVPLENGLEYAEWQDSQGSVKLHLLRVNLNQFELRPILAKDFDKSVAGIKEYAQNSQALAALNANFFDTKNKPLGLVLRDKKILNAFHPTTWWASFLVQGKRARIAKVFKKDQLGGATSGWQVGPRLVINGSVPKLKDGLSPKSAIGIDAQGRVVLVVSEGAIEVRKLAKVLSLPKSKNGVELRNVLNLDGGKSTQFYLRTPRKEVYILGLAKIPVVIGVFRKKK